ncbi:hypothetical protein AB1Y20_000526 [Prymnesium parvum]|uniref:PDZ domain-containing protein n=1 Tax=Prymnesium parvum TaxID=97485 RepID=A0AB34K8K8_PRYPA
MLAALLASLCLAPPAGVASRMRTPTLRSLGIHANAASPGFRFASRLVRDRETGREKLQLALEPTDPAYVVRAMNVTLTPTPGLGIELEELAGSGSSAEGLSLEGQLVVIAGLVPGGAAATEGSLRAGDTIVAVQAGGEVVETEAVSYETLMQILLPAVELGAPITLTIKRIVPRGRATVTAVLPEGEEVSFPAFAGENLRMSLLRQGLVPNDSSANRYDNKPAGSGNCGGNGLCCTCVVSVMHGAQHFSPQRASERQLLRKVARWRQSCRARFVLEDYEEAEVKINLAPRRN